MLGASVLGIGTGVIGTFSVLRGQALISDAVSHASLPGIGLGFLIALAVTGDGRNIVILVLGAGVSGGIGIFVVQWITRQTRLTEDAAIGTVLSVFFGVGIVLMSHIQTLPSGGQAGLDSFLLGSTATMTTGEATTIAAATLTVTSLAILSLKEFAIVCFDPEHAATLGLSVQRYDLFMTGLLLAIVAIGLKTVGLILIIALVIIPPVAARFWTNRLDRMVLVSGFFGGLSCYLGSAVSAVIPHMPTGALIVLISGLIFMMSLCVGTRRGMLGHLRRSRNFRSRVAIRQGLITISLGRELELRNKRKLSSLGYLEPNGKLTRAGAQKVQETIADLELWNQYLMDYPDQALGTVEWGSRPITDVLPEDLVVELRARLPLSNRNSTP